MQELDEHLALLSDEFQGRRISSDAFEEEEARLLSRREQLVADSLATNTRMVAVIDSKAFYDLGGVIRPDVEYLVGLNRTVEDINVYRLTEIPHVGSNIFWGETRDDVVAVLE